MCCVEEMVDTSCHMNDTVSQKIASQVVSLSSPDYKLSPIKSAPSINQLIQLLTDKPCNSLTSHDISETIFPSVQQLQLQLNGFNKKSENLLEVANTVEIVQQLNEILTHMQDSVNTCITILSNIQTLNNKKQINIIDNTTSHVELPTAGEIFIIRDILKNLNTNDDQCRMQAGISCINRLTTILRDALNIDLNWASTSGSLDGEDQTISGFLDDSPVLSSDTLQEEDYVRNMMIRNDSAINDVINNEKEIHGESKSNTHLPCIKQQELNPLVNKIASQESENFKYGLNNQSPTIEGLVKVPRLDLSVVPIHTTTPTDIVQMQQPVDLSTDEQQDTYTTDSTNSKNELSKQTTTEEDQSKINEEHVIVNNLQHCHPILDQPINIHQINNNNHHHHIPNTLSTPNSVYTVSPQGTHLGWLPQHSSQYEPLNYSHYTGLPTMTTGQILHQDHALKTSSLSGYDDYKLSTLPSTQQHPSFYSNNRHISQYYQQGIIPRPMGQQQQQHLLHYPSYTMNPTFQQHPQNHTVFDPTTTTMYHPALSSSASSSVPVYSQHPSGIQGGYTPGTKPMYPLNDTLRVSHPGSFNQSEMYVPHLRGGSMMQTQLRNNMQSSYNLVQQDSTMTQMSHPPTSPIKIQNDVVRSPSIMNLQGSVGSDEGANVVNNKQINASVIHSQSTNDSGESNPQSSVVAASANIQHTANTLPESIPIQAMRRRAGGRQRKTEATNWKAFDGLKRTFGLC